MNIIEILNLYRAEISASFFALMTFYGLWRSMVPDAPLDKRIRNIHERRTELIQEQVTAKRKGERLKPGMNFVKTTVERMKLMSSKHSENLSAKLAQAGYRSRDAMQIFLFSMVALPTILGVFSAMLAYGLLAGKVSSSIQALICVAGVFAGYYAPSVFIKNMKQKRAAAIQKGVPDALDLLVICAQAGLSLDAALGRVSNEMASSYPELSDELSLTSVELGFLAKRSDALYNLGARVDLSQMRSLVSTLVQTEKYGTPLSQSLRVLAAEYRDERMMKAEEKAARLPAILTLPMIVFILPPLFIVLLGPGILNAIDSFNQMN